MCCPACREGSQSPLSGTSPATERVLAMTRSPSVPGGDSVVHLIIRKPYNLGWRHRPGDGRVELSISAEATAGAVAAELEVSLPVRMLPHRLSFDADQHHHSVRRLVPSALCALSLSRIAAGDGIRSDIAWRPAVPGGCRSWTICLLGATS